MYEVKIFTEKQQGQKVILAGPFMGSWTHALMIHTPIVNRIREDNPDAYIVSGGLIGEDFYYQTDKGERTIDAYIGYPSVSHIRKVFGLNQRKYHDDVYRFKAIAEKYFGLMAGGYIQPGQDHEWVSNVISRYKRTMYRIGSYAPEPIDNEKYIVLHARPFNRFNKDTTPLKDAYSRDDPYWKCTAGTIKLLSEHYRIYVVGLKGESYEFDTGGPVSSLFDIPMDAKPAIMSSLVNNAECVVSTMSSAVASFGLFTGCPVIQFDTKRYVPHLAKWNIFETFATYLEAGELDARWRFDTIMKFIDDSKDYPRYKCDVVREDDNLTARM